MRRDKIFRSSLQPFRKMYNQIQKVSPVQFILFVSNPPSRPWEKTESDTITRADGLKHFKFLLLILQFIRLFYCLKSFITNVLPFSGYRRHT